ncbi:FtsX-like permease family protein [Clostridium tepidiprofundi DSM 19306]|uniref:FtsX-like permease family protein n=1 Tax=Clostridium tepidiprofundi DSM 19306 TaxID=1121338 RepID=A0A151B6F0_9CLOT|nr:FtsX-like permease family protein [Clostridium tepidiprofundi]KYH35464.1 FtsX-like permease family protein [Clostridium tepidiprofundi DSM 19306]
MVIDRKVKRVMFKNKSQYLGSIMLIIISCMLFSVFNIPGNNIINNLSEFRKNYILEDASFVTQNPISNISEIENNYNAILEERKLFDYKIDGNTELRVLKKTDKIDKYVVVKGKGLKNKNEILLEPNFAKANKLSIDSTIEIEGEKLKVVGYAVVPDYVFPVKSEGDMFKNPKAFGFGIVSDDTFNQFNKYSSYYSIKFLEDNKKSMLDYLNKNNFVIKWIDKKDNMRISFVDNDLKGLDPMGKYLPGAIILLTCILISVVISRLIKKEYIQIGTLYALGYRKEEILRHYLRYSFIISIVGSLIGTVLGMLFCKPFLEFTTSFYDIPLLSVKYYFGYLVISLILPFVFLIPTTYLVVNRALKLSPLKLMKGGVNKSKVNILEKKIKLNKYSFVTKFRIREVVRNIPRSVFMILGVTFASMLLLIGFATKDSMDYALNKSYIETYNYQYDYRFNGFQFKELNKTDKISFSPCTVTSPKSDDNVFIIYGVQKNAKYLKLRDNNKNLLNLDNVIITRPLADKLNINIGDSIEVKNKLNSKKFKIKIDNIAETYIGEFVFMPLIKFNSLNGYPKGSYIEVYSKDKIDLKDNESVNVSTRNEILDGYQSLMKPFKSMIGVISLVSFIIGLIVIYIVTSLIIEENKQNISMLKVLGYKDKQIYSLILKSNTVLVILGYIISIPLLYVLLGKFFEIMTKEMNYTIPTKLNNINIFLGSVFILVAYEVSIIANRRKVIGISMSESLKNRNE